MKKLCFALLSALLLAAAPAAAQWQTPNHSVPIGKGGGNTGFSSAAPGTAGRPLISNGASADPAFGTIGNSGFTAGAANTVKGSLNGTTTSDIAVPNCTSASQALQWTAGVGPSCGTLLTLTGYDMPINMGLTASAVGNALTINLTTAAGAVPSGSSPVLIPFRSTTITSGGVSWGTVSAATSIVIPSGATLGTSSSNVSFRVWVFAVANGGTPALGVATCSNFNTVFPCASWENTLKTTTTISAGAASAGVLYVTAGIAADAVRIIGYCDFTGGLTTAGAWASSCTGLQVFGPGIKKPGDVVQSISFALGTPTQVSCTVTPTGTNNTGSISLTSAMNHVRYYSSISASNTNNIGTSTGQMYRGSSAIGPISRFTASGMFVFNGVDLPNTTSSTTYGIKSCTAASTDTTNMPSTPPDGATLILDEIMG